MPSLGNETCNPQPSACFRFAKAGVFFHLTFFKNKNCIKHYLFTSESFSEGHPDKVADQISDAILDEFLAHDPQSKVACETLVTTGQVVLAGEVKSEAYIDLQRAARRTIARIGYTEAA